LEVDHAHSAPPMRFKRRVRRPDSVCDAHGIRNAASVNLALK
jgi:hypothetical protein